MTNLNGHIDKVFRDAASNYRQEPPEEVWSRVQSTLQSKQRRKRFILIRNIAAAAVLLLMVSLGYLLMDEKNRNSSEQEQLSEQKQIENDSPSGSDQKLIENKETENDASKTGLDAKDPAGDTEMPAGINKLETEETEPSKRNRSHYSLTSITSKRLLALDIPKEQIQIKGLRTLPALAYGEPIKNRESDSDVEKGQWVLAANVSPAYSFRRLKQANGFPQNQYLQNISYYNEAEDALMGLTGGIMLRYQSTSAWQFSLGVNYSRAGHVIEDLATYYTPSESGDEFTTSSSLGVVKVNASKIASKVPALSKPSLEGNSGFMTYRVDGYLNDASIVHSFHYVEVPFMASYKFIDHKFDVSASAGINAGFLINQYAYIRKGEIEADLSNFDAIQSNIFNALFGLNFEYPLGSKVALSLQPTFKMAISPLAKLEGFKYMPYQYYLATGISYQF